MPKRTLVERRPWLLASLVAAIAYQALKDNQFPGVYLYAFEAASLILLAIYAALRHKGGDVRLLVSSMALAGVGVVAVELDLYIGAVILIISHSFATALFVQNRRHSPSFSQKTTSLALLLLTPLIAWLQARNDPSAMIVTVYGLALGGMGAAAWSSNFSRYRVGAGGVLIVFAALFSISGMGLLAGSMLPGQLSWPLYYLGHFMLCTGVIQTLRGWEDDQSG